MLEAPANNDTSQQNHIQNFLLHRLHHLCVGDGDFDFYARLNADGGDLLDNLRRTVQVNQTLVDPHLEAIPGLRSLTTGGLPGGDAQSLVGETTG